MTDRAAWDVLVIRAGLSTRMRYYSPDVLKVAARLYEGAVVCVGHDSLADAIRNPAGRPAEDRVGILRNARFESLTVDGRTVQGIRAILVVESASLRATLREGSAATAGLGLSHNIQAESTAYVVEDTTVHVVDWIKRVRSVDVVTDAACGGRFLAPLAV